MFKNISFLLACGMFSYAFSSVKSIPVVSSFVAVGGNGTVIQTQDNTNWYFNKVDSNKTLSSVYQSYDGNLIIYGDGVNFISKDGILWTSTINSNLLQNIVENTIGQFVGIGVNGYIYISKDGETWSDGIKQVNLLSSIATDNNLFVTVGINGTILSSKDGVTWTASNKVTSQTLYGVAYGSLGFFSVGAFGTILSSSDGQNWVTQTSGTNTDLYSISYNGNNTVKYIAVGKNGIIVTSNDGVSWVKQVSGVTETLYSVAGDNAGNYMAVGQNGVALLSNDGINWKQLNSGTTNDLYSVTAALLSPSQPQYYSIGGNISGLNSDQSITLIDAVGGQITVTGSGNFTLPNKLLSGTNYNIVIYQQPLKQTCNISNNNGVVKNMVNNILVQCNNQINIKFTQIAKIGDWPNFNHMWLVSWVDQSGNAYVFDGNVLWKWDGIQWTNMTPNPLPTNWPKFNQVVSWVDQSGNAFLFGIDSSGFMELWKWDGVQWTNMTPSALPTNWPIMNNNTMSSWVDQSGNAYVFGGNVLWKWDGVQWTNMTPSPLPTNWPMLFGSFQFSWVDRLGNAYILGSSYGGINLWKWDGSQWYHIFQNSDNWPPCLFMPWMNKSGNVYMFCYNVLWKWDGSQWYHIFQNSDNWPSSSYTSWIGKSGNAYIFDQYGNLWEVTE